MFSYSLLVSMLVGSSLGLLGVGRQQAAGVRGVLMCNSKPASNVKVKLYDDNTVGFDTLLQEGRTDSQGRFQLQGSATDITTMDPKLNIYHDCERILPCQRKITVEIPHSYVNGGQSPSRYYDAGTLQLAGKWKGETTDCIN